MVLDLVGWVTSKASTTELSAASMIWILPLAPQAGGVEKMSRRGMSAPTAVAPLAGNIPVIPAAAAWPCAGGTATEALGVLEQPPTGQVGRIRMQCQCETLDQARTQFAEF